MNEHKELIKIKIKLLSKFDIVLNKTEEKRILKIITNMDIEELYNLTYIFKFRNKIIKLTKLHSIYTIVFLKTAHSNHNKIDKYQYNDILYSNITEIIENKTINEIKNQFEINDIIEKKEVVDIKKIINSYEYKFKGFITNTDIENKLNILFKKIAPKEVITIKQAINMYYIVEVIEGLNNCRYCKLYDIETGQYKIYIAKTNQDIYDFLDVDRVVKIRYTVDEFIAFEVLKDLNNYNSLINDYIIYAKNVIPEFTNQFVDNDIVLSNNNKLLLQEQKRIKAEKIAEIKNKKYKERIKNLNNFKKNGITFNKDNISYEGVELNTNGIYNFEHYLRKTDIEKLTDFNTLFNKVIDEIMSGFLYYSRYDMPISIRHIYNIENIVLLIYNKNKITLIIDKKTIVINKKQKYTINGIRINKLEINDCIKQILCYPSLEKYNDFLKTVSKCSLKFHKAISNGITRHVSVNEFNISIELKIIRKKNKNYLLCGKKELSIRNSNALIEHNTSYYPEMIKIIYETVNITFPQIKLLIKEGIDRYKKVLARSEKLLKEAKELFKIKKEQIDGVEGYTLFGISGNKYLVEDTAKCGVYQIINGKKNYRCIIDQSSKNHVGKDKLVSRFFALYNDSMLAKDISTLKIK